MLHNIMNIKHLICMGGVAATLALGLALSSCDRAPVPADGGKTLLSVRLKGFDATLTKAELQTASEKRVESIDVFVFRDGALEKHVRKEGDGITSVPDIDVTYGEKVIYTFCNYDASRLSSLSSIADCIGFQTLLTDNGRDALAMRGNAVYTVSATNTSAEVSVRRDVARVDVISAPVFSGSAAGGSVQGIYLINVPKVYDESVALTASSASDAWNFDNAVKTAVDSEVSALTSAAVYSTSLYGMPNASEASATDASGNAVAKDYTTKLVIKALVGGQTYWYPVAIPDMTANKYYKIDNVKIAVLGSDNPNDYVTFTDFSVSVDVQDWDEESVTSRFAKVADPANGHAYVDLGLRSGGNKILFATMNIGASSETDYGDYFAWGETSKHYTSISSGSVVGGSFGWASTPYSNADGSKFTKYTADKASYALSGTADGLTTLEPSDDIASVMWGGSWRMPDSSEFEELLNNSYSEWVSDYNGSGVAGLKVNGEGPFSSSVLFLPAAGSCINSGVLWSADSGDYWSRSVVSDNTTYPNAAWGLHISGCYMDSYNRCYGLTIRPVLVLPE